jgi:hypothetical protein
MSSCCRMEGRNRASRWNGCAAREAAADLLDRAAHDAEDVFKFTGTAAGVSPALATPMPWAPPTSLMTSRLIDDGRGQIPDMILKDLRTKISPNQTSCSNLGIEFAPAVLVAPRPVKC